MQLGQRSRIASADSEYLLEVERGAVLRRDQDRWRVDPDLAVLGSPDRDERGRVPLEPHVNADQNVVGSLGNLATGARAVGPLSLVIAPSSPAVQSPQRNR